MESSPLLYSSVALQLDCTEARAKRIVLADTALRNGRTPEEAGKLVGVSAETVNGYMADMRKMRDKQKGE